MSKKPIYARKVERVLISYPSLKVGMANEAELEKEGLGALFPTITPKYDAMPSGGGISNPTETYAIKRAEKYIQVRQIERAFGALTFLERDILEKKYFNPSQPSDADVYRELGLGSTSYYKIKSQMLKKVALGLNIL